MSFSCQMTSFFQEKKGRKLYFIPVLKKGKRSSLYTLSVSLKYINVGVGYAVWAGIGTVGAAIFGFILFYQQLSLIQIFWLVIITIGVIWLKIFDGN
ncbi:hypothetical protein RNA47_003827 [Morganella morganii]|nr:hypothetical protein [Morganella morganii]